MINTIRGMVIDVDRRRPMLGQKMGGMSGPALKPLALRMVYEVYREVSIPIIGMGGIASLRDALEFFMAGAAAVQVGTALVCQAEPSIHHSFSPVATSYELTWKEPSAPRRIEPLWMEPLWMEPLWMEPLWIPPLGNLPLPDFHTADVPVQRLVKVPDSHLVVVGEHHLTVRQVVHAGLDFRHIEQVLIEDRAEFLSQFRRL